MAKKIVQKKGVTHLSQIQLFGTEEKIGSETVTVYFRDQEGNVLLCAGTTVPTNGTPGYAKGALFFKTNVAAGSKAVYQNIGTTSSCNFSLM